MSQVKYLLDEHVNVRLRKAIKLLEPGIIVWRVGDPGAPPLHTSDPDILLWCEVQGFLLVTNNRASMPVHLQDHWRINRHIPGILVLNPAMGIGETAEELFLIWGTSEPEEFTDHIRYLPIST